MLQIKCFLFIQKNLLLNNNSKKKLSSLTLKSLEGLGVI